jgi:cysteine desulfurase
MMSALRDVAVSNGAACGSAFRRPSHVLRAIGRSAELAQATLRFGLGRGTTAAEIARAAEHVVRVVARVRGDDLGTVP